MSDWGGLVCILFGFAVGYIAARKSEGGESGE